MAKPRKILTAGVLVASVLVVPAETASAAPGTAAPSVAKPSLKEAQAKLEKLSEKIEKLVDNYNKLNEGLKAAKRKLDAANKSLSVEQAKYDKLHEKVAQMASSAYQSGDVTDISALMGEKDPSKVLEKVSLFSHMSADRSTQLAEFLAGAQRVQRDQAQAKQAHDEVNVKKKQLSAQKKQLGKDIEKQQKLVEKLGGNPTGGVNGGTYTGPATGPPRKALNYAHAQLGKPYIYGGTGPKGYDCSGLMMMSWKAAGVNIPRVVPDQASATRRVSYDDLQPGDIVFFNSYGHNGMYIGNNKMLHAPRTGKNLEIVPINEGYYKSNFMHGGRP